MKKIQKRVICALLAVTLLCGSLCAVPVAAGEDAVTEAVASQEVVVQTEPEQVQSPPENVEPEVQADTDAPREEVLDDSQASVPELPEEQLPESLTKTDGEAEQTDGEAEQTDGEAEHTDGEQPSQSEADEGAETPAGTAETAKESATAGDEAAEQSPTTEETAAQIPVTAETATGETATAETATAETATAETASPETAEETDDELGESSLVLVQPFADIASIEARPMRLFSSRMQTAQLNLSKTVSEKARTKDER